MSYFKKFTDLVGGIGAFFASLYFIGQYMMYDPKELEEGVSKLSQFLSNDNGRNYRQYIVLIALLVFSVAFGRIFKKLPTMTLCVSVFPLMQVMGMFYTEILYDHTEIYFFVSILLVLGNLYELIYRDRTDGGMKTFYATGVLGVLTSLIACLSLYLDALAQKMSDTFLVGELSEAENALDEKLKLLGIDVVQVVSEEQTGALIFILLAIALGVALSFALKGVYFIDVITAAIPFVYAIFALHTEKLSTAPMLILVPVCVYFVCRVALFITGVGILPIEKKQEMPTETEVKEVE